MFNGYEGDIDTHIPCESEKIVIVQTKFRDIKTHEQTRIHVHYDTERQMKIAERFGERESEWKEEMMVKIYAIQVKMEFWCFCSLDGHTSIHTFTTQWRATANGSAKHAIRYHTTPYNGTERKARPKWNRSIIFYMEWACAFEREWVWRDDWHRGRIFILHTSHNAHSI